MAVDTAASGSDFRAGEPKPLFPTGLDETAPTRNHYVNSTDGQRFLFPRPLQQGGPAPFTVVLDWATEFRK